ncbi:MAG: FIST C domain protein [Chlorobi bacterium OLB4]|nr:MAG: FIST C domain protein [Chlorobi bacterium OLB4]
MISCVGRKLILKQMVEEEVDAVRAVFNNVPVTTGSYSYGEISPFSNEASCELHNQTMTITALKEIQ